MGTEKQRKRIIEEIKLTFENNPYRDLERKKINSEIAMRYGVTVKKADEYIQMLLDYGFLENTEIGVTLKKDLEDGKYGTEKTM